MARRAAARLYSSPDHREAVILRLLRYHLDEHVPDAIADGLRYRGIDVTTTNEAGLLGAPDHEHLSYGRTESRVVVTYDRDFAALHSTSVQRPHRGIVYRPPKAGLSIGEVVRGLHLYWELLPPAEFEDPLLYLTRELVRGL